jgi:hypothetical protein
MRKLIKEMKKLIKKLIKEDDEELVVLGLSRFG